MTGLTSRPAVYTHGTPALTLAAAGHDTSLHELDRTTIRALVVEAWALGQPLTVNGNMDHFQRGVGARTVTTTFDVNTSFSADRMFVRPVGASVTTQQSSAVPTGGSSRFSLQVTGAASVTTVDIGQRIEAAIVTTRGLQSQVFSCYVYNNTGASFTPSLQVGTPGSVDVFTTVTNRLNQALQACPDATWTLVWAVFNPTAYTNVANGMEVVLRVPTGVLVATKVVRIAQFDLRPGSDVLPYIAADPAAELWRCLPYCWVTVSEFVGLAADATLLKDGVYRFPRTMRVAPTATTGSYGVNAGSAGTFRAQQIGLRSAFLDNSAANWTTSAIVTATATWSSELA